MRKGKRYKLTFARSRGKPRGWFPVDKGITFIGKKFYSNVCQEYDIRSECKSRVGHPKKSFNRFDSLIKILDIDFFNATFPNFSIVLIKP